MCRFLVYKGSDDILLSKLILEPTHSILKQSFDSRLRLDTRRGQNNADGFGIGFYTDPKLGACPCLFTSTIPAWNCTNLQRISSKTASQLVFAHVRATTEGSLSEDNCHPFAHGSLMWMHNGGLGGWKNIKRRLGERLADKWYLGVVGGTDSEWAFALFLDTLERMGHDPSSQPENGFGPTVLRKAMLKTIQAINDLIDSIPESVVHSEKVDTRSLLNFAVADGHSVICTRYVSSSTDEAASLYYSSGTMWQTKAPEKGKDYQMERSDKGADVVLVASEPLTFERENWSNVPTNSILTIHKQTVMIHPILDRYYNRNPYHHRSATFVHSKGLAANDKDLSRANTPVPTPLASPALNLDLQSRLRGHTIPFHPGRSRTPETTIPRIRTPLHRSESCSPPPDVRNLTEPPTIRSPPPNSQNIKKKRQSLGRMEPPVTSAPGAAVPTHAPGHQHLHEPLPPHEVEQSPVTPDQPRPTEYGNPNKIAQFFPELGTSVLL